MKYIRADDQDLRRLAETLGSDPTVCSELETITACYLADHWVTDLLVKARVEEPAVSVQDLEKLKQELAKSWARKWRVTG